MPTCSSASRRVSTLARAVALGALVALAAACGGGSGGDDDASPTTPTSVAASTVEPTTTTGATTTTTTPAYTLPFDELDVLPDDDDLAEFGLTSGGYFDADSGEASFCGVGVTSDVPGWDGGNLGYDDEAGQLHLEATIWGWADVGSAQAAYDLSIDDLACGSGSFDAGGQRIEFTLDELDLGAVYGDDSYAASGTISAGGETLDLILAQVRVEAMLLQLAFTAPAGTTDAPDRADATTIAIIDLATRKVMAVA